MIRNNSIARIAVVVLLAAAIAVPSFAARGSANFTTFVAIGDSYGAGYEASSLNERHQIFSWPAIIARQVGLPICQPTATVTDVCFAVPLITYPGLPAGELVLNATGSGITQIPGSGGPAMFGFGRAYNNLSVPGYTIGAALALTGAESTSGLGQVILRGRGNEVDQALSLHPTFIAVWLGGNDFLGAVSTGRPSLLTPLANFTAAYNTMLDKLIAGAPEAGIVVGNLPANFASAPLTARLPGILLNPTTNQPVIIGGAPVPLIFDPGDGNIQPLPAGSIVLLSALTRLQQGVGIPPNFKTIPPFSALPLVGTPLTDAETITPAEQVQFATAITAYNAAITAAAASHNVALADIKSLFDRWAASGTNPIVIGPFAFSNTFATGGLFSLDGVHPSDLGYILFANEFIKAINASYDVEIPLAGIAQLFQNNGAFFPDAGPGALSVPADVAAQMTSIFNSAKVPAPPKRRSIH
ncbi:MAG: SGNH/GDSL hydrolase family protein [Acidobacteriota bacterium]